jgi:hypothetical protein
MTKEMGVDYSLQDRFDPKKSAEVAEYFTQKQKQQLEKSTGKEASSTDLYMAHFLGAGGAGKFINAMKENPAMSAAQVAGSSAASANKNIFFDKQGRERSLQEVYDLMGSKVSKFESKVDQGKIPAAVAALGGGNLPKMPTAESARTQMSSSKESTEKPKTPIQIAQAGVQENLKKISGTTTLDSSESTIKLLQELNMSINRLVALTERNQRIGERQLNVQKSLSGDGFVVA